MLEASRRIIHDPAHLDQRKLSVPATVNLPLDHCRVISSASNTCHQILLCVYFQAQQMWMRCLYWGEFDRRLIHWRWYLCWGASLSSVESILNIISSYLTVSARRRDVGSNLRFRNDLSSSRCISTLLHGDKRALDVYHPCHDLLLSSNFSSYLHVTWLRKPPWEQYLDLTRFVCELARVKCDLNWKYVRCIKLTDTFNVSATGVSTLSGSWSIRDWAGKIRCVGGPGCSSETTPTCGISCEVSGEYLLWLQKTVAYPHRGDISNVFYIGLMTVSLNVATPCNTLRQTWYMHMSGIDGAIGLRSKWNSCWKSTSHFFYNFRDGVLL